MYLLLLFGFFFFFFFVTLMKSYHDILFQNELEFVRHEGGQSDET